MERKAGPIRPQDSNRKGGAWTVPSDRSWLRLGGPKLGGFAAQKLRHLRTACRYLYRRLTGTNGGRSAPDRKDADPPGVSLSRKRCKQRRVESRSRVWRLRF